MNVNGTRIKDEVIRDLRGFIQSRPAGFTSDRVEAALVIILKRYGQPASLAISMTQRFLEEERARGWVAVVKTRDRGVPKPMGKNVWQITMAGLHRGAEEQDDEQATTELRGPARAARRGPARRTS